MQESKKEEEKHQKSDSKDKPETKPKVVKPFKKRMIPLSETSKMDKFVEYLYQEISTQKPYLANLIRDYIQLNGEYLLSLSDSSGDYLTHHVCTMLHDGDENLLKEVLQYLLNQSEDIVEETSYANFMKGLISSRTVDFSEEVKDKDTIASDQKWQNGLIQTQQINIGNSLNQTPLHLLASHKKPRLLQTFLEMVYKRLKNEKLKSLKAQEKYSEFLDEIVSADMRAFSDIRNILFDREFGTNILTDLATNSKQQIFLKMLKKITETPQLMKDDKQLLSYLLNLPSEDGYNVVSKLIMQFNAESFEKVLDLIGLEMFENLNNQVTNQNQLHFVFLNSHIAPIERMRLYKRIKLIGGNNSDNLAMQVDKYGHFPLNYLIHRIALNKNISNEDMEIFREIMQKTEINCEYFEQNRILLQSIKSKVNDYKDNFKIQEEEQKIILVRRLKKQYRFFFKNLKPEQVKRCKQLFEKQLLDYKIHCTLLQDQLEIINPLDIAIKLGQTELIEQIFEIIPPPKFLSQESINLALKLQNVEVLKCLIKFIDFQESDKTQFFKLYDGMFLTLILTYQSYQEQETFGRQTLNCTPEQFLEVYQELIQKLLPNQQSQEYLKEFIERNKLSVITKDMTEREVQLLRETLAYIFHQSEVEMSNVNDLALLSSNQQNWPLLKALKPLFEQCQNEKGEDKNLNYLLMFEEQAVRHDFKAIQNLLEIFPNIKNLLTSEASRDKQVQQLINELGDKMLSEFKNIVDPETFEKLNSIGIYIPFTFKEVEAIPNKLLKLKKDSQFLKLTINKKSLNMLTQKMKESAAQVVVNHEKFYQKINKATFLSLSQISTEPDLFIALFTCLLKKKVMFSFKPRLISQFQVLLRKYLDLIIYKKQWDNLKLVLDELYIFVSEKLSHYPINYRAELQQFTNNFPYRKSKITSLIRKLNLTSDEYPQYLGSYEKFVITDDDEDKANKLFEDYTHNNFKNSSQALAYDDKLLIPNGLVFLFNTMNSMPITRINIERENQELVRDIAERVVDLNGMPFISITNLNNYYNGIDETVRQRVQSLYKLLKGYNTSFKQGHLQTILHKMAELPQDYFDSEYLKSLVQQNHLLSQSLNSFDRWGLTPIIHAINNKNWNFLEVMLQNNHSYSLTYLIFEQEGIESQDLKVNDNYCCNGFYYAMQKLSPEDSVRVLSILSRWMTEWMTKSEKNKFINYMQQSIKHRNKLSQEDQKLQINENEIDVNPNIKNDDLQNKGLMEQSRHKNVLSYHENYTKKQNQQEGESNKNILNVFMDYAKGVFCIFLEKVGDLMTVKLYEEIKESKYNLSQFLSLCNKFFDEGDPKIVKFDLPYSFPFELDSSYNSFLLKWILLNQGIRNPELIEQIFKDMDHNYFKTFALEITCLIGKQIGTNNHMFLKYFKEFKSYLCGRELTVESYFLETQQAKEADKENWQFDLIPPLIQQYYDASNYENMIATLLEVLLENQNDDMAETLLDAQQRIYLTDSLMKKIQNTCLRYLRSDLLLKFGFINIYKVADHSEIMENLNAKVTIKQLQHHNAYKRFLHNGLEDKHNTIGIQYLTHEQIELFFSSHLDKLNGRVDHFFKKYINDDDNKSNHFGVLQVIIHKISFELFERYFIYALKNYDGESMQTKFRRMILKALMRVKTSATEYNLSKKHAMLRQKQMMQYLNSKAPQFAINDSYYELICGDSQEMTRNKLGLKKEQYQEYVEKIKSLREKCLAVQDLKFDYKSLSYLMKHGSLPPQSNIIQSQASAQGGSLRQMMRRGKNQSSVREFQSMSKDQIINSEKEEISTMSNNLILLKEYLTKIQQKGSNQSIKFINSSKCLISDKEIREQREQIEMENASNINFKSFTTLFSSQDSSIYFNELEDQIILQKLNITADSILDLIDTCSVTKTDSLWQKSMKSNAWSYHASDKTPENSLSFQIKFMLKFEKKMIGEIKNLPQDQIRQNNDDDENDSETLFSNLDVIRKSITGQLIKMLESSGNPFQQSDALLHLREIFQADVYSEYLKVFERADDSVDTNFSIGDLSFIKEQSQYECLRQQFFEQHIKNEINNFKREAIQQHLIKPYMYPIYTIFKFDDEELQRKIITSEKIMSLLPVAHVVNLFMMLANKPTSLDHYVNSLLKLMIPHLGVVNNLSIHFQRELVSDFKLPVKLLATRDLNFRLPLTIESLNDPVSYLIKCNRFNISKEYLAERGGKVTIQHLLTMLMCDGVKKDQKLFEWMLSNQIKDIDEQRLRQQRVEDLEDNEEKPNLKKLSEVEGLYTWLLINVKDIEQVKWIDQQLGGGLLDKDIDYQNSFDLLDKSDSEQNGDQNQVQKYGILHNLLSNGYYKEANLLVNMATESQRKQLIEVRRPFNELLNKETFICPYTLALINSQYGLCDKLLPQIEKQHEIIQSEDLRLIYNFLKTKQITVLSENQRAKQISQFMIKYEQISLISNNDNACDKFQILKKMLLVPSLFSILGKFEEFEIDQDQSNDDEEEVSNKDKIHFKLEIEKKLYDCCGISLEIDAFMVNSLTQNINIIKLFDKYMLTNPYKLLLILEKGLNMNQIVQKYKKEEEIKENGLVKNWNIELLTWPYTYLEEKGIIEEKQKCQFDSQAYEEIFKSHDIQRYMKQVQENPIENQLSLSYQLFGEIFKQMMKNGTNPKHFGFNHFMMEAHKSFHVLQDLKPSQIVKDQWLGSHKSLAHRIIALSQTNGLFKSGEVKIQDILGFDIYRKKHIQKVSIDSALYLKDQKTLDGQMITVFRNKKEKQILSCYNAQELAFLIYVITSWDVQELRQQLSNPEMENVNYEELYTEVVPSYPEIPDKQFTDRYLIEYYLQNAVLHRQSLRQFTENKDSVDFDTQIFKIQLLGDALKLLHKTCSSQTSELKMLAQRLSHNLKIPHEINHHNLLQCLDQIIRFVLPIEDIQLNDNNTFHMKFEVSKTVYLQVYAQLGVSEDDKLGQIVAKLNFQALHLSNLVDYMRGFVEQSREKQIEPIVKKKAVNNTNIFELNQKAMVTLDFDIVLTGKSEVKKVKDYTFYIVINISDLVEDINKLEPIGLQLQKMIMEERINRFTSKQQEIVKQWNNGALINNAIIDFERNSKVIEQYSLEDFAQIDIILNNIQSQKDVENNLTLYGMLYNKEFQDVTFESLSLKLMTVQELKFDLQQNLVKYVKEAFELKSHYGDVDIKFAFDTQKGQIIISEYAFLPRCRQLIEAMNDRIAGQINLSKQFIKSKKQDDPKNKPGQVKPYIKPMVIVQVEAQTFFQSVLKYYKYESHKQDPIQIVERFLVEDPIHILSVMNAASVFVDQLPNIVALKFRYQYDDKKYEAKVINNDSSLYKEKLTVTGIDYNIQEKPQEDDDPSSDVQLRGDITGIITIKVQIQDQQ